MTEDRKIYRLLSEDEFKALKRGDEGDPPPGCSPPQSGCVFQGTLWIEGHLFCEWLCGSTTVLTPCP